MISVTAGQAHTAIVAVLKMSPGSEITAGLAKALGNNNEEEVSRVIRGSPELYHSPHTLPLVWSYGADSDMFQILARRCQIWEPAWRDIDCRATLIASNQREFTDQLGARPLMASANQRWRDRLRYHGITPMPVPMPVGQGLIRFDGKCTIFADPCIRGLD